MFQNLLLSEEALKDKTNDQKIACESHEFFNIDSIYFSFSELYSDTVINDKMKINQTFSKQLLF